MNDLKIRFSKENIDREAKLICAFASDEVLKLLKGKSNHEIVRIGLIHLTKSGELLKQIAIHFPRRACDLPKTI